jgi:hypothetical protein
MEAVVAVPAAEDDGETTVGDIVFTAAESKRIILPLVVPLPYT